MNFDSLSLSILFEKSLIRLTADFGSQKDPKLAVSELSDALKTKVSSKEPSQYSHQLKRTEDGVYHLQTDFIPYKDARLITINLLKWIERNGYTKRNDNLFFDLKFIDETPGPFKGTMFNTGTKIEGIDKLRYILSFDENLVYEVFPERRNGFCSQSILSFDQRTSFNLDSNVVINPSDYSIPNTSNCGINFETISKGFIRLQYIGGENYEKKVEKILSILNQFTGTAWDCCINKKFTKDNINRFERIVASNRKMKESYYDFQLFNKNFPKVKFSIDLVFDYNVIYSFYHKLRDRFFEIFSNCEFKGSLHLNYDTTLSLIQIKDANILNCKEVNSIEFINCKIKNGAFNRCDFYDSEIIDSKLNICNVYLHTKCTNCNLFNSYINRTTEIVNSDFDGADGVLNGKMVGGVFKKGKIGLFNDISKETTVIEYQRLKTGYIVAGDQIIIPTKKYRQM
jgi:hypothetical protein